MENGAPIQGIKELLGHSNLAATQVYTHNSVEKMLEILNKLTREHKL
ncbi:MAG: tyrosine-type recombinase/integrase [Butyricimonas faecalis]